MVAAATAPVLTPAEIDSLMEVARSGILRWRVGAEYGVGAVVAPSTGPLDHQYVVTVAGLAGVTEPTWPSGSGDTVTQGAVTYQESGSPLAWSLYAAAAEGWLVKAGKAASRFDFSADGQTYDRSQVHKMALEMRASYLALAAEEANGTGPVRRRGLRTVLMAPSGSHLGDQGHGLEYHPAHDGDDLIDPDHTQEV